MSGEHATYAVYSTLKFTPSTNIYKTQIKIRNGKVDLATPYFLSFHTKNQSFYC